MNNIGIRKEDKYAMERRAPLTPKHVERLIKQDKLNIIIQSSDKRIFTDIEFLKAGAIVKKDLKECSVILGIKEVPPEAIEEEKTYVIFAHVIKGQPCNMPMLKKMVEKKCNLIDYEKIEDELGRRLIFFGRYAGLAGMLNTLWAYGLRLKYSGKDNPFMKLKQAHNYHSIKEAKKAVSEVGFYIAEHGLPSDLAPLIIGITGYGNVSSGAQEMCGLLPVMELFPDELQNLYNKNSLSDKLVYKVVFREEDMVEPVDKNTEFDLSDYYSNPSHYKSGFEKYLPYLSLLINCIYWEKKYPRMVTKDYLEKMFIQNNARLAVIGDISCDIEGSVECTLKQATIENPLYVYNPITRKITDGYETEGILEMAVDILPSELPGDSSEGFADILYKFVKPIANTDFKENYENLKLPVSVKRGMILHKGKFTPKYEYIGRYI